MANSSTTQGQFQRVLNNKDILALAFGAMIGWGWVVLAGTWVQSAGSAGAIIAFALGGVAVVLIGLVYAELVAAMPLCQPFDGLGAAASMSTATAPWEWRPRSSVPGPSSSDMSRWWRSRPWRCRPS